MYFPCHDRVEASSQEEAVEIVKNVFKQQYDFTVATLNKVGLTFTHPFALDEGVISEEVEDGVYDVKMSMSFAEDFTKNQVEAFNNFMISLYEEE